MQSSMKDNFDKLNNLFQNNRRHLSLDQKKYLEKLEGNNDLQTELYYYLLLLNDSSPHQNNIIIKGLFYICQFVPSFKDDEAYESFLRNLRKHLDSQGFYNLVLFYLEYTVPISQKIFEYIDSKEKKTVSTNIKKLKNKCNKALPDKVDELSPQEFKLCPYIYQNLDKNHLIFKKIELIVEFEDKRKEILRNDYTAFLNNLQEQYGVSIEEIKEIQFDQFDLFFAQFEQFYKKLESSKEEITINPLSNQNTISTEMINKDNLSQVQEQQKEVVDKEEITDEISKTEYQKEENVNENEKRNLDELHKEEGISNCKTKDNILNQSDNSFSLQLQKGSNWNDMEKMMETMNLNMTNMASQMKEQKLLLRKEIDKTSNHESKMIEEIKTLNAKISKKDDEIKTLNAKITFLENEISKKSSKESQMIEDINNLKDRIKFLENENSQIEKQKEGVSSQLIYHKNKLTQAKEESKQKT